MTTYAELRALAEEAELYFHDQHERVRARDAKTIAHRAAAHPAMAPWLANATRMAQVARIFKLQHDDECACEGCNAYEAATDEVEPA